MPPIEIDITNLPTGEDLNKEVARRVFGWQWVCGIEKETGNFYALLCSPETANAWRRQFPDSKICTPEEASKCKYPGFNGSRYERYADNDYDVMVKVRESWRLTQRLLFFKALDRIVQRNVREDNPSILLSVSWPDALMFYHIGDYAKAAIATLNALEKYEVKTYEVKTDD